MYIHVLYEIQGLYILFVFQILQLAFEDHARASTPDTQVDDAPLPAESSSLPALCTTNDNPVPSPPATTAKMVNKKLQVNLKRHNELEVIKPIQRLQVLPKPS